METIWDIFLNAVEQHPNKIAVLDQNNKYTYQELFDKVKSINSLLIKYDKSNPIAIFVGRNIESLAAILAVVSSGNFYIPIDSTLPIEKLKAIFDDANPVAILGFSKDEQIVNKLGYTDHFYKVDENIEMGKYEFRSSNPSSPLYMVYTSGSTGKPKGVLKSHGGMVSFIKAFSSMFPFSEDTIIGNQTPLFFDASAKDIYLSIYNCVALDIIPSEKFVLPLVLVNYLNERKINWICWVPSALCIISQLNTFMAAKPIYLKNIFFVGETFPIKQLKKWKENMPETNFVNLYGSSEIAGVSLYYIIKDDLEDRDVLPMGKPLPNCEISLRNGDKVITNADEVGEVYISSDALALEYYHNEEQTNKVFLVENNKRVFASGDLARYDKEGNLVFVSRKDFQIKHMGRRIELGEIEAACDKIQSINRCCCLYDEKRKIITLFCELNSDITAQEIKNILKEKIADYMIPGKINIYEKLPLNANGKIDRQKLKETFM